MVPGHVGPGYGSGQPGVLWVNRAFGLVSAWFPAARAVGLWL